MTGAIRIRHVVRLSIPESRRKFVAIVSLSMRVVSSTGTKYDEFSRESCGRFHKEKATARPIEEQVQFEPMAPRPSDRFPAPCHGLHTHPGTENNATSNTQAATIDISLCLSRARRDREFVATCDHSLRSPCIRVTSTATKNLYISYYPTVINANADATKSNAKNKKKIIINKDHSAARIVSTRWLFE